MANHKQDECDFEGCELLHKARGYCNVHYQRLLKGKLNPPKFIEVEEYLSAHRYPAEWYDGLWEFVKQELNLTQPERKKNNLASL